MPFPWTAWFTSLDGNIVPLILTVVFQMVYYFIGLYRLLSGRGQLPEINNPEIPNDPQAC
jgi:hypothetical protein